MDAYLLSIDRQKCTDTLEHLAQHGFIHVTVIKGVRPPTHLADSVKAIDAAICKGHWKCTAEYAAHRRNRHVIIFEEDCRFIVPDPREKVNDAVHFLDDRHPGWGSLHVGHTPLSFIWPVLGHHQVWRSYAPVAGHCYVLNGDVACELVRTVPEKRWIRPFLVERMRNIPVSGRFAIYPSIAMQNGPPKEMRRLLGCRMSFYTACRMLETVWLLISIAVFVFIVVVIPIKLYRELKA